MMLDIVRCSKVSEAQKNCEEINTFDREENRHPVR